MESEIPKDVAMVTSPEVPFFAVGDRVKVTVAISPGFHSDGSLISGEIDETDQSVA